MIGGDAPTLVCLVAHRWAPSFAGAALRFQKYVPGLRERGVHVEVVCASAPGENQAAEWASLEPGDALLLQDGIGTPVHHVRLPDGSSLRRNLIFRSAVGRLLEATGAQVAQYLTLAPLLPYRDGILAGSEVRGVFTGTQLWRFSKHAPKRLLQKEWLRARIHRMDHVVVSSVVMRDFYESLGVTIPMSVIPNGVDLQSLGPGTDGAGREAAREALGISMAADVVLFVGSIIPRKGVDLLLSAFSLMAESNPRAEVFLVGPWDESGSEVATTYKERVSEIVSNSGVSDRIHFTGYVPNVDDYLRAADVFVLPSRREGMGNVVLEAMATGTPTVLTPYLGLPTEFGVAGKHYLLSDPDESSLAEHLGALLSDRDRRVVLGQEGRRWVESHMSMSSVIEAYAMTYRDLAAYGEVRPRNRIPSWIE